MGAGRRGAAAFRHAALHSGLRHLIRRSGQIQNRADDNPNARADRQLAVCAERQPIWCMTLSGSSQYA